MGGANTEFGESLDAVLKEGEDEDIPSLYKVLLHNDDYSTMEFVVEVLISIFHKTLEDATQTMLNVHHLGVGLCGIYPYEIAESKVAAVTVHASAQGFPLRASMERE